LEGEVQEVKGKRLFGDTWRDVMDASEDARVSHWTVDAVADEAAWTWERRSRLHGRVRYLMARAELRGEDFDVESAIDDEIALASPIGKL
jgi:hypothetical protein